MNESIASLDELRARPKLQGVEPTDTELATMQRFSLHFLPPWTTSRGSC